MRAGTRRRLRTTPSSGRDLDRETGSSGRAPRWRVHLGAALVSFCILFMVVNAHPASAQVDSESAPAGTTVDGDSAAGSAERSPNPGTDAEPVTLPSLPTLPVVGDDPNSSVDPPTEPTAADGSDGAQITVDLGGGNVEGDGSGPIQIIIIVTLVALLPSVLVLVTSFTRIMIVLGLSRNALNLQGVPPNQVLVGLSLFLSLFIMSPVFKEANEEGLQPYLDGEMAEGDAFDAASAPFKDFMLAQVRDADLGLFIDLAGDERPDTPEDVALTTLIPAFVISELRTAFLIGFVVFVPFLIIDMVVSATLMSMGMVMLPPVTIALPFKLLLFVMVDGWRLLAESLISSFKT